MALIMNHAVKLVVSGVAIGLGLGLAASRVLQSYLFQISPSDPMTYTIVATATVVAALLACVVPAYRATLVDPAALLRSN